MNIEVLIGRSSGLWIYPLYRDRPNRRILGIRGFRAAALGRTVLAYSYPPRRGSIFKFELAREVTK